MSPEAILENIEELWDEFTAEYQKTESGDLENMLNDITNQFIQIATQCEAVICCRVTPKQKRDVVYAVKK